MLSLSTVSAMLLTAFSVVAQAQSGFPRDFSIRFEFGLCWRDIVDTSRDRYVRDLATESGAKRTVRLGLSAAQRLQLSRWVEESRFFELPHEIEASVKKDGVVEETFPSPKYSIEVRRSGARHVVEFDDNGNSTSESVQRVRTLVQRLERFFTELAQVKRLPAPAVGCL